MNIKDVVNNKQWQDLRKSFLGTWKRNQVDNVKRLRIYLDNFSDQLKLRRALNYLTGSGFRTKVISHPEIDKLLNEIKKRRHCDS